MWSSRTIVVLSALKHVGCGAARAMAELLRTPRVLGMTIVVLPAVVSAQGVIAGRVTDATNAERSAGVAVSIVGTSRGAIADGDGRFVIPSVPLGAITLRARLLGYKTIERAATLVANDTTRVDFALEAEAALLNAVRTEARPIERDL